MTSISRRRTTAKIAIWTLIGVGVVVVGFEVKATWHVFVKEREVKKSYELEREAFQVLEERKSSLEQSVDLLNTPRGIEEVVRSRYPLAKSGEEVILLVDSNKPLKVQTSSSDSLWESVGRWFDW